MNSTETHEKLKVQREKLLFIIDGLLAGDNEENLLYNLNCLNKALSAYKLFSAMMPAETAQPLLNITPEIIEKIETEILHLR